MHIPGCLGPEKESTVPPITMWSPLEILKLLESLNLLVLCKNNLKYGDH